MQTVLELSSKGNKVKNKLTPIYAQISQKIIQGSTLAEAMKTTKEFNNFDCYSVLIGENTGGLAEVFSKLSTYYNKKISQKRKITSALSYPSIVLFASIGAIYFMLRFVVPMFSDTLTRFGGELPPVTQFIIALSHHVSSYLLIISIFFGFGYFVYHKNKDRDRVQHIVASIQLNIPIIGKMIYKTHLLQFTQAMDLLLNAKVNIVDSIDLTKKMIQFYPLTKALENIKADILQGDFFYRSMEKQSFFENSMLTLIKIGEEVNQLDKIFVQLSKQYESELEFQSTILFTVLEPLVILFLAGMVAIILVAMYLPMFKLGTAIH